ncbi:MAG: hypothetical protein QM736_12000 [Vicinamibacterales bacterium]
MNGREPDTPSSPLSHITSSPPSNCQCRSRDVLIGNAASREQFSREPGEETIETAGAARQQRVCVASLRHAAAMRNRVGQTVALDERHAGEVIRQHTRGQ